VPRHSRKGFRRGCTRSTVSINKQNYTVSTSLFHSKGVFDVILTFTLAVPLLTCSTSCFSKCAPQAAHTRLQKSIGAIVTSILACYSMYKGENDEHNKAYLLNFPFKIGEG